MWGREPLYAADAAAAQSEVLGVVGVIAGFAAFIVVVAFVVLRMRRRAAGVHARAVIAPPSGALPPPPYPEAGIAAPITAPGHLQSPDLEFEPPQVVRADQ